MLNNLRDNSEFNWIKWKMTYFCCLRKIKWKMIKLSKWEKITNSYKTSYKKLKDKINKQWLLVSLGYVSAAISNKEIKNRLRNNQN
jgi:hypothetical protein